MTKEDAVATWIEWVEPFIDSDPVYCRVSPEAAIKAQKRSAKSAKPDFEYPSDAEALDDFMTVHWATAIE